jgi:hypothetical protein
MEFKDYQKIIYNTLKREDPENISRYVTWRCYIESKDLGIRYTGNFSFVIYNNFVDYEVVDQKKWLLTKIKYGI